LNHNLNTGTGVWRGFKVKREPAAEGASPTVVDLKEEESK